MDPDGSIVAIKVVDLQGLDEDVASEYKNEVDILAKLQDSGYIVRLID
jgi:hypothetical protein